MNIYNTDKNDNNVDYDYCANQLIELIGTKENITEEELEENYGITMKEYLNPILETIEKVKLSLDAQEAIKRR